MGLLWSTEERLRGGEEAVRNTLMVNAALMYEDAGKMRNKVQVIDIGSRVLLAMG